MLGCTWVIWGPSCARQLCFGSAGVRVHQCDLKRPGVKEGEIKSGQSVLTALCATWRCKKSCAFSPGNACRNPVLGRLPFAHAHVDKSGGREDRVRRVTGGKVARGHCRNSRPNPAGNQLKNGSSVRRNARLFPPARKKPKGRREQAVCPTEVPVPCQSGGPKVVDKVWACVTAHTTSSTSRCGRAGRA